MCEARFRCEALVTSLTEARSGRKEESVDVRQPGDLDSGRGRSEPLLPATAFHEEEEEEEFHEEEGSGRGSSWHHVRDAPRKASSTLLRDSSALIQLLASWDLHQKVHFSSLSSFSSR